MQKIQYEIILIILLILIVGFILPFANKEIPFFCSANIYLILIVSIALLVLVNIFMKILTNRRNGIFFVSGLMER